MKNYGCNIIKVESIRLIIPNESSRKRTYI